MVYMEIGRPRGIMYLGPVDVNNLSAYLTAMFEDGCSAEEALAEYVVSVFNDYPLNRVYSFVPCESSRYMELYTRAGFTPEGRLTGHLHHSGRQFDACPMGMLRSDLSNHKSNRPS